MAHDFLRKGPLHLWNPTNPELEPRCCYNEDAEAVARKDGFISAKYIPSKFPTTLWNVKTGGTLIVKDQATKDRYVDSGEYSETQVEPPPAPEKSDTLPSDGFGRFMDAFNELRRENESLEEVVKAQAESQKALMEQVSELATQVSDLKDLILEPPK